MADLKRWFKVWTSLLTDMDNQTAEDIGHWTRLGCRIALVGTSGSVVFDGGLAHAAKFLGLADATEAGKVLARLPGVVVSDKPIRWPHGSDKPPVCAGVAWYAGVVLAGSDGRGCDPYDIWCRRHGSIIVTMTNWKRYQEDTTAAERGRALRAKRRREETRGEEKILIEASFGDSSADAPGAATTASPVAGQLPKSKRRKREPLPADAEWLAAVRALPLYADLDVDRELGKLDAWLLTPKGRGRKKTRAFLVAWLNRALDDQHVVGPQAAPDPYEKFPRAVR